MTNNDNIVKNNNNLKHHLLTGIIYKKIISFVRPADIDKHTKFKAEKTFNF